MKKNIFLKILIILFSFCILSGLSAFADDAQDYALTASELPGGWKILEGKYLINDDDYVQFEKNTKWTRKGTADFPRENYAQVLETDNKIRILVAVNLYPDIETARKALNNDTGTKMNIADEGLKVDTKKGVHFYEFRIGRYCIGVISRIDKRAKQTIDLILKKIKGAPLYTPSPDPTDNYSKTEYPYEKPYKEPYKEKKPFKVNPLAVIAGILGAAAGLAGLIYLLAKLAGAKAASITPKKLPEVQFKKPKKTPKIQFEKKAKPKIEFKKDESSKEKDKDKEEKQKAFFIDVSANKTDLNADGKDSAKITAYVTDFEGNPVPGIAVLFTASRPNRSVPPSMATDSNGTASFNYISSASSGTQLIQGRLASDPLKESSARIDEEKRKIAQIELDISPEEVPADGESKAEVRIFASDNKGGTAKNEKIELWFKNYDGSKIEPGTVITDENGEARAEFTSGKHPGEQKISAASLSDSNVANSISIQLKKEICYEARDSWTNYAVRVILREEGIRKVTDKDIVSAKVIDPAGNKTASGFGDDLLSLAAVIGNYGVTPADEIFYKQRADKWEEVNEKCRKSLKDLENAGTIGDTVQAMCIISVLAEIGFSLAGDKLAGDAIGGAMLKYFPAVMKKVRDGFSKGSAENQEIIMKKIERQKKDIHHMERLSKEIADIWKNLSYSRGNSKDAAKWIEKDYESDFYINNILLLEDALDAGRKAGILSAPEEAKYNLELEGIRTRLGAGMDDINKIKELRQKIRSSIR
ncbi:MAG: Ig-like domain-containing protein [Armatimonadota bacterium]